MAAVVLVVEDEDLIGDSLRRAIAANGYEAHRVATLDAARRWLGEHTPDLVLLDLSLPDGDGIELCTEMSDDLRHIPVVMLTSRTSELDIVNGLNAGAVDYINKPFRLAELLARIGTHLRYAEQFGEGHSQAPSAAPTGAILISGLAIDPAARRAELNGSELALRPKEFDLLYRLMSEIGVAIRREQLIADVWDEHWWGPTKTLDVHINMLRQKIDRSGTPSRITTLRGVGYRFEAE